MKKGEREAVWTAAVWSAVGPCISFMLTFPRVGAGPLARVSGGRPQHEGPLPQGRALTFDGDLVLAGAGVREQVHLDADLPHAALLHGWRVCGEHGVRYTTRTGRHDTIHETRYETRDDTTRVCTTVC